METCQFPEAKLLIVDDNRANVLLLEKMLKVTGFSNFQSTTDSREVIALYDDFQPDILLLDLRMPHINGFQIMKELKELHKEKCAPIIVITAQDDKEHRQLALKLGARDFIAKPFDREELIIRINNALEMQKLHNELLHHNKQLEAQVEVRTKELQESQLELLRRLGRAAEYRDNETGLHIFRMSLYSAELAKEVGFSESESKMLMHASALHDIGKISVPDDILLKPSRLTEEEWSIMRRHTTVGAEILAGSASPLLQMAEEIAFTHHEKWDGGGYPRGIKGEEIPLVGRITAICDVFDALTSERPYKRAWSVDEAVSEIMNSSGTHFDPNLVEKFIGILPKIKAIQSSYHNEAERQTENLKG
ncbi:response regulator [Bacillus tianshenii]|nr:response regulator [Bacillus tianshenii]